MTMVGESYFRFLKESTLYVVAFKPSNVVSKISVLDTKIDTKRNDTAQEALKYEGCLVAGGRFEL
jgi:predicted RNA-binding protein